MNHKKLVEALRKKGIECHAAPGVFGTIGQIPIRGRVICGANRSPWPHEITFWVHCGKAGKLIGLWSGRIYKIQGRRSIIGLIELLLNGDSLPNRKYPSVLPRQLTQEYGLIQVE